MPITLTVGGVDYEYPISGEEAWGEQASDWAEAVTDQLSTVSSIGDIQLTTVDLLTNSTNVEVSGLSFDTAVIKGAFVEYNIQRSDDTPQSFSETGTLVLTYDDVDLSWDMARYNSGSSGPTINGVQFNITSAGQVRYTSDNMSGSNYTGKLRFRARVIR